MKELRNYILLGDSETASKLYYLLKDNGFDVTIAPTPRNADHCCGLCIIYEAKDRENIAILAEKNSIKIDRFWEDIVRDDPNRMRFC